MMDLRETTPLVSNNQRGRNATHGTARASLRTNQHERSTCNRSTTENTRDPHVMANLGTSHSGLCGKSSEKYSRNQLREILQKEETESCSQRVSCTINTAHSNDKRVELHYVLCSPCFDDIVVISPPNIDSCNLTENYHVPQYNQI